MAIDPKDLAIHDEVVIETEIDGVPVAMPAFITNVLAEELWLATRLPDVRLADFEAGQPIHLAFDRGGALIVESVFLRRLGGASRPGGGSRLGMEKSRVFAVRRPQGVDTVQRRAHVRADLQRAVRIRSMGSLDAEKIGSGRTINIGAGGVQFVTDMPLLFGEQLRIALVLTARDIVVAGGTIVRIEDGDDPAGGPAALAGSKAAVTHSKVAVRFDKISETDQERITCHLLSAHRRRSMRPAAASDGVAASASEADTPGSDQAAGSASETPPEHAPESTSTRLEPTAGEAVPPQPAAPPLAGAAATRLE